MERNALADYFGVYKWERSKNMGIKKLNRARCLVKFANGKVTNTKKQKG